MKKMKRVLAFILCLCCILNTNISPFATVSAMTTQVNVTIDGNGGYFDVTDATTTMMSTMSYSNTFDAESTLADSKVGITEPVNAMGIFLGWDVYTYTMEDQSDMIWCDSLGTTQDMLSYALPSANVLFQANWDLAGGMIITEVILDANGGTFEYTNAMGTGIYDKQNECFDVDTTLASNGVSAADPDRYGYFFDGWVACDVFPNPIGVNEYTPIDGTILSTSEMLDYIIPETTIAFVAQWTLDPTVTHQTNVFFVGNEGTFTVTNGESTENINGTFGDVYEANSTIAVYNPNLSISTPVFWDSTRSFLGWQACTLGYVTDETGMSYMGHVEIPGVGILTTEQTLNYTLPYEDIYFVAQWDGDDSDYYSNVYIDGYGGDFEYNEIWYDSVMEENVSNPMMTQSHGFYLKENNETFEDQISSYFEFTNEPVRMDGSDAAFEGWIQFTVNQQTDAWGMTSNVYTLIDQTIYTTAQMLASTVPADDIAFVAKWSDIDFDDYYANQDPNPDPDPEPDPEPDPDPNPTIEVMLYADGGDFLYTESMDSWNTGWQNAYCAPETDLSSNGISIADPVKQGYIFDGWLECTYTYDENSEMPICTPIEGAILMDSATLMTYQLPNAAIGFVAQWSVDPNWTAPTYINVFFKGNGTEITMTSYGNTFSGESCGDMFQVGTTVNDSSANISIATPVYWDGVRPFIGWRAYHLQQTADGFMQHVEIAGAGLMTTEDILAYKLPSEDIYFIAQWDGDDGDYFSDVVIDGYGGTFSYAEVRDDGSGSMITNPMTTSRYSSRFKANNMSIQDQLGSRFAWEQDPDRTDATFEGWIQFTVNQQTDDMGMTYNVYTLVDQTIYTTAQMLATEVSKDDITFAAKWSDIDFSAYYSGNNGGGNTDGGDSGTSTPGGSMTEVSIYADGGDFGFTDSDGMYYYSGWQNVFYTPDTATTTTLTSCGVNITDPVKNGYIFDGWVEATYTMDQTTGNPIFTPVTGAMPITTNALMSYPLSGTNIAFMAQWSIDNRTYVNVSFDGNDGIFDVVHSHGQMTDSNVYMKQFPVGSTLIDYDASLSITTPVFWDSTRAFTGWMVCERVDVFDENGNHVGNRLEQLAGTDILTTTEALNYVVPNEEICFVAQYAGNDADYYSEVRIEGYHEQFSFNDSYYDFSGQLVTNTHTTDMWSQRLKQNNESIDDLIGDHFSIHTEPSKADAIFQGWIEFKIEEKTDNQGQTYEDLTLVSQKIYTTAEIMSKAVPAYDVAYVAKWSDIDFDDYFAHLKNASVIFRAEPGRFYYDDTLHGSTGYFNGTQYQFEIGTTLSANGVTVKDPVQVGSIFNGWKACTVEYTPEGPTYLPIPGADLLSTTEVLSYTIPRGDIAFVADWETDSRPIINVIFNCHESILSVDFNGNSWTGNVCGEYFPAGSTAKEYGFSVTDPVFWDSTRPFWGWMPCKEELIQDESGNTHYEKVQIPGSKIVTTAEALEYTLPEHDIYFVAQWAGDDSDYYSHVYIHGYGTEFTFTETFRNNDDQIIQDVNTNVWGNDLKENNESIAEQTKDYFTFKTEPSRSDATFEGWLEFKVTYETDENGYECEKFTLVNDTVYTTAQMLAKTVPAYDVAYVAKWSDMDAEDYFPFDGTMRPNGPEIEVVFDGKGGTFELTEDGETRKFEGFGRTFVVGTMFKQYGISISDPVFWDNNRTFEGWMVCRPVEKTRPDGTSYMELEQIAGTGLLSSADVVTFEMPTHNVRFVAQWAGNDSDYYSNVCIDGYGAQFTFTETFNDRGHLVTQDVNTTRWGNDLKENNESIAEQVQDYFTFKTEPQRSDATFEGWLEFKVTNETDANGNEYPQFTLVSDTVYTTAQMLAKTVPAYDVTYVAKWSDIPVKEYFTSDTAVLLSANGGEIELNLLDENGQQITIHTSTTEWWYSECYTVADGLKHENAEYVDTTKKYATLTGWTVYEFEGIGWEEVPAGQELSVGDPDTIFVYFDTYTNDDGQEMDRYLAMMYPNLVSTSMSTDDLFALTGEKMHYAFANWQEASAEELAGRLEDAVEDSLQAADELKDLENAEPEEKVDAVINVLEQIVNVCEEQILDKLGVIAPDAAIEMVEKLAEVEESIKNLLNTSVSVEKKEGQEDFELPTIQNALLSVADGDDATIKVDKVEAPEIPGVDKEKTVAFTMELFSKSEEKLELKVPVVVDLPIPEGIDPDKEIVIHHFHDNSEEVTEKIHTKVDKENKKIRFVTGSFSTFVVANEESEVTGVGITGTVKSFGSDSTVDNTTTIKLLDASKAEVAQTTVSTNEGNYTLSDIPAGTYTLQVSKEDHVTREYTVTVGAEAVEQNVEIWLKGDVNGDGDVTVKDKKVIFNHMEGTSTLADYAFAVGDVDGNGDIVAKDKKMIYNHIEGNSLLW